MSSSGSGSAWASELDPARTALISGSEFNELEEDGERSLLVSLMIIIRILYRREAYRNSEICTGICPKYRTALLLPRATTRRVMQGWARSMMWSVGLGSMFPATYIVLARFRDRTVIMTEAFLRAKNSKHRIKFITLRRIEMEPVFAAAASMR